MHIYLLGKFRAARHVLLSGLFLLTFIAALTVEGRAQTAGAAPETSLTREQLEQLLAPIALYPDSLLAQVLMASTYPLEVVQAARWAGSNSKLKAKALEDALQPQSWDPSVKSIVVVPQVLQLMNDKLDWTEMLGNAFLAQQADLLRAVQDAALVTGQGRVPEYAQKFRSSPGKKEGLYWSSAPGEKESPLGPLLAEAVKVGYRAPAADSGPVPYQGYYFRILTGQGDRVPDGAYDYVAKGKMIGGFAVIAYPARYGVSGVKTFMVNQNGIVYEADLGPQTAKVAEKMQKFDPGTGWSKEAQGN